MYLFCALVGLRWGRARGVTGSQANPLVYSPGLLHGHKCPFGSCHSELSLRSRPAAKRTALLAGQVSMSRQSEVVTAGPALSAEVMKQLSEGEFLWIKSENNTVR